jgi:hypothetical protein
MINGATTCPSSSAESGGVDCVPGALRSAVYGGAHCWGPAPPRFARVRRVLAHLWSLAVSTACLVRPEPQRPPRVRWGSLRGSRPASFRVRRVPAHLWSLAMSTACLVRPDLQRPPRVRWGSLSGSRSASFRRSSLAIVPMSSIISCFSSLGPCCQVLNPLMSHRLCFLSSVKVSMVRFSHTRVLECVSRGFCV